MKKSIGSYLFLLSLPLLFFLTACGKSDDSLAALLQKSFHAAEQADWKDAQEYAEKALELDSANTEALILNALALENNDKLEQALVQATKAALDRESFMAQYTYGRMLVQNGDYEQSLAPLSRALSLNPEDANTLVLLGRASTHLQISNASSYYGLLYKKFPEFRSNAVVLNELALLELIKNNPDKTAAFLFPAVKLAPDNPDIVRNCAIFCDYYPGSVSRYFSRIKNSGLSSSAKDYYARYLRLTAGIPELEKDRIAVEKRLSVIR